MTTTNTSFETNELAELARAIVLTAVAGPDCAEARRQTLVSAADLGAPVDVLGRLSAAVRVSRKATIVLPPHRYETLSRGSGWCRMGRGDTAKWGERTTGGYRVGPGRWTVQGSDGFSRRDTVVWTVEHVTVGAETWTVAA